MFRAVGLVLLVCFASVALGYVPSSAKQHKSYLTRIAKYEFGLDAPISMFAAQIHQESAWRSDAESPYAQGISQFTPDTAEWISSVYSTLRPKNVWDPRWGIKAMVIYNKHLLARTQGSTSCDDWAMALAAYNGGLGWINRDARLAEAAGDDPTLWWDNVENYSDRADWAFKENRTYPRKILLIHQEKYLEAGWHGVPICIKDKVVDVPPAPVDNKIKVEVVILMPRFTKWKPTVFDPKPLDIGGAIRIPFYPIRKSHE